MMYEIHAELTHRGADDVTDRFRTAWSDDYCTRETVSVDECTVYIDRYDAATSTLDPYTIQDDLVIVVEGVIHDLTPDSHLKEQISVSTATAPEIVAAAYRQFGWTFPRHLVGDYRFLCFDRSREQVIAGRDKTTYDPIYVAAPDQRTLVSTDLAALAADIEASVNDVYLGEYLTGTIESEHQTFYTEINRIPPGCVVLSSEAATEVKRYYHPSLEKRAAYRRMTRAELAERLREKLDVAVSCRISPSEKTGVFMSGGADSTAIAGLVTHHEPALPLKTYSYTYPNTSAINEADGIDAAVTAYSLPNERISLDDYWVLKDKSVYERAWATTPAVDPLIQPKDELLQRAAADQTTTMLVGDKGNMFDGHRLSIADALRSGHVRDAVTTARDDPVYTTGAALVRYGICPLLGIGATDGLPPTQMQDPVRSRLTERIRQRIEKRRQTPRIHPPLQCLSDQRTYRSLTAPLFDYRFDILRKLAKHRGMEVVDPYQDSRLVEFVFNLPPTYNLHDGYDKALFRQALRDILPERILSRRKTDRVEEEVAEGLRREQTYITSLLNQRHLNRLDIVQEQDAVPDTSIAIKRFGDIDTPNTHLWEFLSAQAWLEYRKSATLDATRSPAP